MPGTVGPAILLGRAWLLLGRLDEARRLADRAVDSASGRIDFVPHALHLLGDIATHPDRFDAERGETHYRNALALAESRGMRPLVAHCHLGLGTLYARTGKREQAAEHLGTAASMYRDMDMRFWLEQAKASAGGRRTAMTVFRWSQMGRSWQPVEGEAPEGLGGAQVGLYEVLMTSASAYALSLHADRIARSWERLTGRPFSAEAVPPLPDVRAEVIRQQWPALRFEVRRFADGSTVAQIRRRDKPSVTPPVQLLPVEGGAADAAYPHKSVERDHLRRAYERAVAAGADDALFVVAGEVRETAQAFVGFVTAEALGAPAAGSGRSAEHDPYRGRRLVPRERPRRDRAPDQDERAWRRRTDLWQCADRVGGGVRGRAPAGSVAGLVRRARDRAELPSSPERFAAPHQPIA